MLGNVMWLALPLVLMCCQGQEQPPPQPQPVYFEQPPVEAPIEPVVKPTPRPQVKELDKGLGEAQKLLKGMRDR